MSEEKEEDAPAAFLPDDVVVEILARVPLDDVAFLFRCAVVCKRWLRILGDPAVGRRLLPAEDALLGFFVRSPSGGTPALVPQALLAGGGAYLRPERRHGRLLVTSFIRDDDNRGLLKQARPLAARDGLLLLRVYPLPTIPFALRLCVCNLLTGDLHLLPPLDACHHFDERGIRGAAVLTAAASESDDDHRPADGYSTCCFQVLLLGVSRGDQIYYVHSFSSSSQSTTTNWSATPTSYFRACTVRSSCCRDDDTPHWHVRDESEEPYVHNIRGHHLLVWSSQQDKQDDDGIVACCWRLITQQQTTRVSDMVMCVAERRGILLALVDPPGCDNAAYLLDLQSGTMVCVQGWNRPINRETAVPCEINWPVFFTSRLGGRL